MKIIITGGMGFIGNSLAAKLLEEGHQVISVGRTKQPPVEKMLKGLEYFSCNLAEENRRHTHRGYRRDTIQGTYAARQRPYGRVRGQKRQ